MTTEIRNDNSEENKMKHFSINQLAATLAWLLPACLITLLPSTAQADDDKT
jgi:hypothetical protein